MRCWLWWLVLNGRVKLDWLMFENLFLSLFVGRIVRVFVSFRTRIFDVVIMIVVFKGGILEVIGRGITNKCMVLYESYQYWFHLILLYNTHMPYINVMKKFQWEEIQLCEIFVGAFVLLVKWELQGWEGGVAWGQEVVLVPGYFYYWYVGSMMLWISHIGPPCIMLNTTWKYKTNINKTLQKSSDMNMFFKEKNRIW